VCHSVVFLFFLLLYSLEKQGCTDCHGNSMCAVCFCRGIRSLWPPRPPSAVFALPFTQRHVLPRGLTRQKQEMVIMLTVMLINAETPDTWVSANII